MKYRLVLEIELRPLTQAEILKEGVGSVFDEDMDLPDDEFPSPDWLGDAIQEVLNGEDAEHLIFDGSGIFFKIVSASCVERRERRPMNATDRAAFLEGINDIARTNVTPATRAAFVAVAEALADNCGTTSAACEALKAVIKYGQAVAADAYDHVREVA